MSLTTDVLVQIADVLATDHGPVAALGLLTSCQEIHDLCSHLLLRDPSLTLRLSQDPADNKHLQSFCEFVLAKSGKRLFHFRNLILEIGLLRRRERYNRLSVELLMAVLEKAKNLERLILPQGLYRTPYLAPKVAQLSGLRVLQFAEFMVPATMTLLKNFKPALTTLTMHLRELRSDLFNLMDTLASQSATLEDLDLECNSLVSLECIDPMQPVVFPKMRNLSIRGTVKSISVDTLITSFPNLRRFHISDVRIPAGEVAEWTDNLHKSSLRTLEGKGWKELDQLSSSAHILYGLALSCKVGYLCIAVLTPQDADRDRLIAICGAARPSTLHLNLDINYCSLSVLSDVIRASGATMVDLEARGTPNGNEEARSITERKVVEFFDGVANCIKDTRVSTLSFKFTWEPLEQIGYMRLGAERGILGLEMPPEDQTSIWLQQYNTQSLARRFEDGTTTLQHIFIEIFQYPHILEYWRAVEHGEARPLELVPEDGEYLKELKESFFGGGCCICCPCHHAICSLDD
ncbi:unnamed protein product [Somion occarium]|uniref:Uncharacterized protein n=1 Tax=Somion occarium TaxID=3059160 RepID=A0ABP1CR97_9APHY